ncbi:AbrB/MazE/SpoVT family DNA-binding domain-containing protein [Candidatus Woesearchaeota archaeon]|nr:AbrB/MazE/SpoVT family DNA-binding domain-containing protein [Candidatus Woesearchaeota archaeon]
MAETELVKMSSKGQLVVPDEIRKKEGFAAGDRFIPFPISEGIIFRKVDIPEMKKEFQSISRQIEAKFRKEKVSEGTIKEAIQWSRGR